MNKHNQTYDLVIIGGGITLLVWIASWPRNDYEQIMGFVTQPGAGAKEEEAVVAGGGSGTTKVIVPADIAPVDGGGQNRQ